MKTSWIFWEKIADRNYMMYTISRGRWASTGLCGFKKITSPFELLERFRCWKCIAFILACHLLGDYLEAVKKDYEKAAKIYKNNCDELNFGKSCYKFGNYTLLGKGREVENPKIVSFSILFVFERLNLIDLKLFYRHLVIFKKDAIYQMGIVVYMPD